MLIITNKDYNEKLLNLIQWYLISNKLNTIKNDDLTYFKYEKRLQELIVKIKKESSLSYKNYETECRSYCPQFSYSNLIYKFNRSIT